MREGTCRMVTKRHPCALLWPVALGLALVILPGCQDPERTHARLVRFAEELTFGGPYDNSVKSKRQVTKWSETVRVEISGDRATEYRTQVEHLLRRVSELTGVTVLVMPDGVNGVANFEVSFIPKEGFALREDFVPCYASIRGRDGVISHVAISISTVAEDAIEGCIAHEILHGMGLGHHSGIVRSALSPAHEIEGISWGDELVLGALYDARLRSGMQRAEARQAYSEVIAERLAGP